MRTLAILGGMVIVLAGCGRTSERGGGTERKDTFTLSGPALTTSIKQGETQTVDVNLHRGKDFNQKVNLTAEAPKGIKVQLDSRVIEPSNKGPAPIRIAVGEDAAVGDQTILLTGTPESGNPTSLEVKVRVKSNETSEKATTFSLSAPQNTSLKHGESETVPLNVKRSKDFNQTIRLKAEAPKGLEVELNDSEISAAEKGDVRLKITATKTATAGDNIIRLVGTPEKGDRAMLEVHVKVKD